MFRHFMIPFLLVCLISTSAVYSQSGRQRMPREDVVDVPAIGKGLCLSNVFQSNMVLQRDKPLKIWGWAAGAGDKVSVSFAGQTVETKAGRDRAWEVTLEPVAANSNPQKLTVKGAMKTLTLDNILVGDVWVLGGQSNMEFAIAKVNDGQLEIISANFPQIRLLTPPKGKGFDSVRSFERLHEWSDWSSRHFRKGDWVVCSPETVGEFTAIGYVFGRRLAMATNVPIGLIDTSIGGTTVETWTPADVFAGIDGAETQAVVQQWQEKIDAWDAEADLEKRIANYESRKKRLAEQGNPLPADSKPPSDLKPGPIADKNRPGYCYASVIKPLEGLAVKGAVFHQGFNNCFSGSAGARMYYQAFGNMIASWRAAFDDENLPFCIISLCTAGEPQTHDNFLKPMFDVGALIREAQYRTFCDLRGAGDENIGFVSSFDLRKSWYHPQIKVPAGERTAKWALATQYDLFTGRDADTCWLPPMIEEVTREDGTIRLTMSTQIEKKDDSYPDLHGFAIAGEDRQFHPAKVDYYTDGSVDNRNRPKYQRDVLVLSSPLVAKPIHYRHAWARNPMTNIANNRAVPLATQRSDDWLLEETPVKFPVVENEDARSRTRRLRGLQMKAMELIEAKRRLKEAEAVIAELKPIVEKAEEQAKAEAAKKE